ncbi:MAE_28990/MAE_18760 family HEPN-like nuclease [Deinococcus alpinitundrae]|uniref:MAE_28990/MAE_18760 family HEPN-like nuclease n=1 Tax=Deinococcus alpinitundrae TaxID=468913 RepID=UPI00137A507E|nr:MAE_28990/MAE_18760 family HEPN-like nuclease [Deinococcus alpinitundrae]
MEEFSNRLDQEIVWRLREISEIKLMAQQQGGLAQKAIIRAGLALVYAHWEGFIKTTSEMYLMYIESRGLNFSELKDNFMIFGVKKHINTITESFSAAKNISVIKSILDTNLKAAKFSISSAIRTESNLKSSIFENISISLGISSDPYRQNYNFIDEDLLGNRNRIAHGEYTAIDYASFNKICDSTIHLIRSYLSRGQKSGVDKKSQLQYGVFRDENSPEPTPPR